MGKKKGGKNKQSVIPHKEAMLRMNFLYQAAYTAVDSAESFSTSRYYINTMKTIAKKLVLRIDPSMKRTVCKRCNTLLIPGKTSSSRLRSRREKHVVVKCWTCGMVKRYKTAPGYALWCDRSENIIQKTDTIDP
ncbi:ribonuclease P protein subunit p21-like [Dysidea avara]|uniref:ribonuclease P protein subunit p21-like n=1 Tax=Dysidea avara TaxID=196820 RepID=UPI003326E918